MRYERSEFSITQLNKCLRSKPSQSRRNKTKRKKEVKRKEKRKLPLESESFEEKRKKENFLLKVNLLNFDAFLPVAHRVRALEVSPFFE